MFKVTLSLALSMTAWLGLSSGSALAAEHDADAEFRATAVASKADPTPLDLDCIHLAITVNRLLGQWITQSSAAIDAGLNNDVEAWADLSEDAAHTRHEMKQIMAEQAADCP